MFFIHEKHDLNTVLVPFCLFRLFRFTFTCIGEPGDGHKELNEVTFLSARIPSLFLLFKNRFFRFPK